jgi:hypothetical protein
MNRRQFLHPALATTVAASARAFVEQRHRETMIVLQQHLST